MQKVFRRSIIVLVIAILLVPLTTSAQTYAYDAGYFYDFREGQGSHRLDLSEPMQSTKLAATVPDVKQEKSQ